LERKADDDHRFAGFDRTVAAHQRRVGDGLEQTQDREIGRRVSRDNRFVIA